MKSFLFTAPILEAKLKVLNQRGRCVTRRLDGLKGINQGPDKWLIDRSYPNKGLFYSRSDKDGLIKLVKSPYQIGDICYIKEAMKAEFARHFVRVTDVKVERLQQITLEDAYDEGIAVLPTYDCIDVCKRLWDSLYPQYPWGENPWVWRIELEKAERPEVWK